VTKLIGATLRAGMLALLFITIAEVAQGQTMPISLFKVVTVKDEIYIGLNAQEIEALGGPQTAAAGRIASALADRKALTVWQYVHRKAPNGDTVVAPLQQIGLIAHQSLRIEPYTSPLAVLPHE
jgi:hypothetical protein